MYTKHTIIWKIVQDPFFVESSVQYWQMQHNQGIEQSLR